MLIADCQALMESSQCRMSLYPEIHSVQTAILPWTPVNGDRHIFLGNQSLQTVKLPHPE